VACPRGCALEVDVAEAPAGGREALAVRGNACKRGEDYGRAEVVDPRRSLTSTVRTEGTRRRRLPVRTSGTVPLGRLVEAARSLDSVVARPPMKCGQVLARDLLGLGVDLVATDDLEEEGAVPAAAAKPGAAAANPGAAAAKPGAAAAKPGAAAAKPGAAAARPGAGAPPLAGAPRRGRS